jgi:pimeloyl-ACP methyl ester carboxylesterase
VIAAANPLRSLDGDAAFLRGVLTSIEGPVVAVGHSYGGAVISNAAVDVDSVKALVYVAALAPDAGETIGELSAKFPGSTLGDTLHAVELADGTVDLYITQELFKRQFADDLPEEQTRLNAAAQRPLNTRALNGRASAPAWKTLPASFVFPRPTATSRSKRTASWPRAPTPSRPSRWTAPRTPYPPPSPTRSPT